MPEKGEYELPDRYAKDLTDAQKSLLQAEDILRRLRKAGEPQPEAEENLEQMKDRLFRFADAFDIEIE